MAVLYLTISDAANHAGVNRHTVYRWIQKGVTVSGDLFYLTAVTLHGEYHIEERDLDIFLDGIGYEVVDDGSG